MAKPKYSGVLATPIVIQPNARRPTTILDSRMDADAQAKFDTDLMERRAAVYEHYSIPDDGTFESAERLAMSLACDHVPGFKTADRKPGRPRGSAMEALDVFNWIESYRAEKFKHSKRLKHPPSVSESIRELRRIDRKAADVKPKTLSNLYTAGRKRKEAEARLWLNANWRWPGGHRPRTILDEPDAG